jgi:hypothetical protein
MSTSLFVPSRLTLTQDPFPTWRVTVVTVTFDKVAAPALPTDTTEPSESVAVPNEEVERLRVPLDVVSISPAAAAVLRDVVTSPAMVALAEPATVIIPIPTNS